MKISLVVLGSRIERYKIWNKEMVVHLHEGYLSISSCLLPSSWPKAVGTVPKHLLRHNLRSLIKYYLCLVQLQETPVDLKLNWSSISDLSPLTSIALSVRNHIASHCQKCTMKVI